MARFAVLVDSSAGLPGHHGRGHFHRRRGRSRHRRRALAGGKSCRVAAAPGSSQPGAFAAGGTAAVQMNVAGCCGTLAAGSPAPWERGFAAAASLVGRCAAGGRIESRGHCRRVAERSAKNRGRHASFQQERDIARLRGLPERRRRLEILLPVLWQQFRGARGSCAPAARDRCAQTVPAATAGWRARNAGPAPPPFARAWDEH